MTRGEGVEDERERKGAGERVRKSVGRRRRWEGGDLKLLSGRFLGMGWDGWLCF